MLYHQGMIKEQLVRTKESVEAFWLALSLNPYFHAKHAAEARRALEPMMAAALRVSRAPTGDNTRDTEPE